MSNYTLEFVNDAVIVEVTKDEYLLEVSAPGPQGPAGTSGSGNAPIDLTGLSEFPTAQQGQLGYQWDDADQQAITWLVWNDGWSFVGKAYMSSTVVVIRDTPPTEPTTSTVWVKPNA